MHSVHRTISIQILCDILHVIFRSRLCFFEKHCFRDARALTSDCKKVLRRSYCILAWLSYLVHRVHAAEMKDLWNWNRVILEFTDPFFPKPETREG